MRISLFRHAAILLAVFALMLAGCARFSPAVGTWQGEAKPKSRNPLLALPMAMLGNATATLTVKPDGTAFLQTSFAPEQRLSWTEKDGKVFLRRAQDAGTGTDHGDSEIIGTLSDKNETLTFDLGPLTATLHRQKN